MKKLLSIILTITFLSSCFKQGEIIQQPRNIFKHNNKTYQAFQIAVDDDGSCIWVVLPSDSSNIEPINIKYKSGKHDQKVTIIP